MRRQNLTKTALAAKLGTSRTEIYRLLDPNNDAVSLSDAEAGGGRRREAVEGRSGRRSVISAAGDFRNYYTSRTLSAPEDDTVARSPLDALSLSVHPLRGTKLVRLAYLDEAGVANAAHEPHVVVAGVIINPDNSAVEPRSEMSGEPGLAHSDPDFFVSWFGSPGADGMTGDEMAGILSPRQINYINGRLEQDGESFRLPQKR